jgi:DNA polymerase
MSKVDYRELRKQNHSANTFAEGIFPHKLSLEAKQAPLNKAKENKASKLPESRKSLMPQETDLDLNTGEVDQPVQVQDETEKNEKVKILASFEKYVDDNGEEVEERKEVTFPGGKASQKTEIDHIVELAEVGDDLLSDVNFFDGLPEQFEKIKVVFICERPGDMSDDNPGQDILSKMIQAMKLDSTDYMRIFINKDSSDPLKVWQQIISKFMNYSHLTVVSMGAFTTNTLIGKKERLSKIHGKQVNYSYKRNDSLLELSLFPVFHPDILKINPNMKRSAWIDLQKVMKHLVQD